MKALWNRDKKFLNSLEFINTNLMQLKQNVESDVQSLEHFKSHKSLYKKVMKSFESALVYADGRSWGTEWRKAKKSWLIATEHQLEILGLRIDELDGMKRQEMPYEVESVEAELIKYIDEFLKGMEEKTPELTENEAPYVFPIPSIYDLQQACIENDEPAINRIINYLVNDNNIDLLKDCARQFAAEGRINALEQLMTHAPVIDYSLCDLKGWSLLHWAVFGNQKEMLLFLLQKAPDCILNNSTSYRTHKGSILGMTVEYGYYELFEALLGAKEVESKLSELLSLHDRNDKRPLTITLIKATELLLAEHNESTLQKHSIYLRMMEKLFDLELQCNASRPHSDVDEKFKNLTKKIRIFYTEMDVGRRYFIYSELSQYFNQISAGLSPVYKISAESFMHYVTQTLKSPFLNACKEKQIETASQHVRLFKQYGLDSLIDEMITNCLAHSGSEDKAAVFEFIIDNNFKDPSKPITFNATNKGWNALHWAVANARTGIIEYLINKDPNLAFIKTPAGWLGGRENLLHIAIQYREKKSLQFVLNHLTSDKHPDRAIQFKLFYFLINSKEKNGETPPDLASSQLNKTYSEYSLKKDREMKKIIDDAITIMAANPEYQAYAEIKREEEKVEELRAEANRRTGFCSIM